ncbi:MAG TPA: DsbA family oxidoreductase [Rhizobacter sp.]|nr:DsbA family oxidoreductase [Rhizobacter sp.]
MSAPLRIDFISDVTCPWCAIGLQALEQAIARVGDTRPVELHLQPFELNPGIPPAGEPIADYAARKYGVGADELAARQVFIRQRGAEAGLALAQRTHVYNTFDAHRLIHWAGLQGRGLELKRALLQAYHLRGENPALHEVLLGACALVGLDAEAARAVLERGDYADEVRATVRHWQQRGINSVPSVVIDGRHLISGGQSAEVFEQALREF